MTDLIQGNQLKREGKLEEAIAAYQRAVDSNPTFAWSHHNLGEVLGSLGRLDEAVSAYRRAIELNPNLAWAHHNLGLVLEKQGKLDEAHAFLHKASELNPDFTKFSENLANVIAKRYHRDAITLMIKHKMSKIDEAIACLEKAIEMNQKSSLYYYKLGCLYRLNGNPEKANKHWQKVMDFFDELSIDSNLQQKVKALLQLGKLQKVKNCAQQELERYKNSLSNKFQYLINLSHYPEKIEPDFLIIGAPKCGTSSAFNSWGWQIINCLNIAILIPITIRL